MKLILILLFSIQVSSANTFVSSYKDFLSEHCQSKSKLSELLIKKSVIEALRSKHANCEAPFTSRVLAKCEAIGCEFFKDSINNLKEMQSGNVIGN